MFRFILEQFCVKGNKIIVKEAINQSCLRCVYFKTPCCINPILCCVGEYWIDHKDVIYEDIDF